MVKNYRAFVAWFVLVSWLAATSALGGKPPDIPFEKDLVYATVDKTDLKYDLAKPLEGAGPFPFVLCIHAGGWQLGDKKSFRDDIRELAARGYVAATINYRPSSKAKWPAQIEDVRSAVRYFREHAADLKIDPKRFGAVGDDAGGHLAMMLGLMGAEQEKDKPVEHSTRVQAIVNIFGPPDLREAKITSNWVAAKIFIGFGKSFEQLLADLTGTADRNAPAFYDLSPVAHVTPAAPPILTIIGTADPLITVEQITTFHEALKKAGTPEEVMVIENGEHDRKSFADDSGADERMFGFFDKHLKGAGK